MSLHLSPEQQIASGVQRTIFPHPTDPTKLIKVLKHAKDMPVRKSFNGVMDRLFPSTRVRQIRKEYREYLTVMLNNPQPGFHPPMAHMFGFVTTSIGLGCLTEKVSNADGNLGETLGAKCKSGDITQAQLALLNDTIARVYKHNIRASDLNPSNLVFGYRHGLAANGKADQPEWVIVDGLGDIHAIPVRTMAAWSNRIALDDSFKRLARNTNLLWDQSTRTLTLATRDT